MKIKLVFDDWLDTNNKPIPTDDKHIHLTLSDFHSGTIFNAELDIPEEEADWLKKQIEEGFIPQFKIWST